MANATPPLLLPIPLQVTTFTIQQGLALFKNLDQEPEHHTLQPDPTPTTVSLILRTSSVPDFCLSLSSTDVCVVDLVIISARRSSVTWKLPYLSCKLQARQGLVQVRLQWTDHDEHKRLRVSTQRELQQVCQLVL